MRTVCILFALNRETLYFRHQFARATVLPEAPCPAWQAVRENGRILVLETGVGKTAAGTALRWVLEQRPEKPTLCISAGFAGALVPGIRVGDLFQPNEIVRAGVTGSLETTPLPCRGTVSGRLLSLDRVLGTPGEKLQLGTRTNTQAVEMESADLAELCEQAGVPFACLRSISDAVEDTIPAHLLGVLQGGQVAPGRLLGVLFRQPTLVIDLWRLAGRTRLAARNLSRGLLEVLAGSMIQAGDCSERQRSN